MGVADNVEPMIGEVGLAAGDAGELGADEVEGFTLDPGGIEFALTDCGFEALADESIGLEAPVGGLTFVK